MKCWVPWCPFEVPEEGTFLCEEHRKRYEYKPLSPRETGLYDAAFLTQLFAEHFATPEAKHLAEMLRKLT